MALQPIQANEVEPSFVALDKDSDYETLGIGQDTFDCGDPWFRTKPPRIFPSPVCSVDIYIFV